MLVVGATKTGRFQETKDLWGRGRGRGRLGWSRKVKNDQNHGGGG